MNLKTSYWKSILQDIYCPVIGSLWDAPNGIWNHQFAKNTDKDDYHPSVIRKKNGFVLINCLIWEMFRYVYFH